MLFFNYIIPGIFDPLQNAEDWDFQAQVWLHDGGYGMSAGFNYFATVLGGAMHRAQHAGIVATDLRRAIHAGLSPRVVGHSNGVGIILESLAGNEDLRGVELHLIAGAVATDCDANGLNLIAQRGQVSRVVAYVSVGDEILGLAPGFISYGEFGKKGPTRIASELVGVMEIVLAWPPCSHCDWVGRDFEATMRRVVSGAVTSPVEVQS